MQSCMLTIGVTISPIAAGVKSIAIFPRRSRTGAFVSICARAVVASNTMSAFSGCFSRYCTPSREVSKPNAFARAIPAESTTPSMTDISSTGLRMTLYIRSVPMLPGPKMPTLIFLFSNSFSYFSAMRKHFPLNYVYESHCLSFIYPAE